MSEYFPEPKSLGKVKVELDLSKYAMKTDLKMQQVLIRQNLLKVDLADLKSDVDKLDINKLKDMPTNSCNFKNKLDKLEVDKLVPVPLDSSKLSDVVKNVYNV